MIPETSGDPEISASFGYIFNLMSVDKNPKLLVDVPLSLCDTINMDIFNCENKTTIDQVDFECSTGFFAQRHRGPMSLMHVDKVDN